MYCTKVLFAVVAAIASVRAYPTGGPVEVCETMAPDHGVKPQTEPFPYDIVIWKGFRNEGTLFRGYMMQARDSENKPVGVFKVSDNNSHTLDCGSGKDNTVTQSNAKDKKEVTVTWTAPANFNGNVIFYVTVVKVFDTYWVAQPSTPVKIS